MNILIIKQLKEKGILNLQNFQIKKQFFFINKIPIFALPKKIEESKIDIDIKKCVCKKILNNCGKIA
jgi:hypothetical protein